LINKKEYFCGVHRLMLKVLPPMVLVEKIPINA